MTGVDTVVARSNVSKTSLYRAFASKDELIATVLEGLDRGYWAWWDGVTKASSDPRAQLKAILVAIARHSATAAWRGCPFINAAIELADSEHPGHARVVANKEELTKRLTDLCRKIGTRRPARLGSQLAMLVNGAYSSGPITGTAHMEEDLVAAALAIVDGDLTGADQASSR